MIISLKDHEAGTQPPSFQCQTRTCAAELAFARTVQKIVNPPVEPPVDLGRCVLHSLFVLMTMLAVNIRFTKFLPLVNFFIGAASFTFLVRWLPWRAPCHQDGRIGMQNLTDLPEISPTRADAWWVERWEVLRRNYADDASTDALITFLRRVLVLNPALRPTVAEVLQDPWFLEVQGRAVTGDLSENLVIRAKGCKIFEPLRTLSCVSRNRSTTKSCMLLSLDPS